MTPEEELELLIAEQKADDVYFIRGLPGHISLDQPAPGLPGSVSDYVGVTMDGAVVCYLLREQGLFLDPARLALVPHGTIGGYNNHRCRCLPCKGALAEYRRRKRTKSDE